jgi:hypothetical protein
MPLAFQTVVRPRVRRYGYVTSTPMSQQALAVVQAVEKPCWAAPWR